MDTPHPNEVVKFCPQCGCKTWTNVYGKCEWSDMHKPAHQVEAELRERGCFYESQMKK